MTTLLEAWYPRVYVREARLNQEHVQHNIQIALLMLLDKKSPVD